MQNQLFCGQNTGYVFSTNCNRVFLFGKTKPRGEFPFSLLAEIDDGKQTIMTIDKTSRWGVRLLDGQVFDPYAHSFDLKLRELAILLYDFLYSFGANGGFHHDISKNYVDDLIQKMKRELVGRLFFSRKSIHNNQEYEDWVSDAMKVREMAYTTIQNYESIRDFSQKNKQFDACWLEQWDFLNNHRAHGL